MFSVAEEYYRLKISKIRNKTNAAEKIRIYWAFITPTVAF
jgi:hypothetical protein